LGFYFYKQDDSSLIPPTQTKLHTIETPIQDSQNVPHLEKPVYTFDKQDVAHILLKQLDVSNVRERIENSSSIDPTKIPFFGFAKQDNYCEDHRANFIRDPEIVFSKNVFLSNYPRSKGPRLAFQALNAVDVSSDDRRYESRRTDISLFYLAGAPYKHMTVGKHFSCLSQVINNIPGREVLSAKDRVGNSLVQYSKSYLTKPQCFNFDKFFPKTWVLSNEEQCKDFFREFTSPKYEELKKQKSFAYFRKVSGVHRGLGVFPVNEEQEKYLIENYKNGTECGKFTEANVMQNAITNSLLINGHKFHFRVYMFVASTNPLIAYYHDGYIRLAVNKYDPNSTDLDTFVTNLGITAESSQKGRQNSPFQGMSDKEIKDATLWFYPQLEDYLRKEGLITDPNWLDNHLRAQFKKTMTHLLRMSQHELFKQSSLSELYGLDFLMDENLDIWFIEANAMPMVVGWSESSNAYFNKLLTDNFEIVLGLLRSRMKRVVTYVNELTKEIDDGTEKDENYILPNLEARRKKFEEITKNSFESEYQPSISNGFQKIIDENLEGSERYMGSMIEECL